MKVVKHVKSNGIVFVKDGPTRRECFESGVLDVCFSVENRKQ